MTVFLFLYEVGTAVCPREFYGFVSKAISRGKIPVAIPRFLLRKKKNTVLRYAVIWYPLWCFCHCLFLVGNFVMAGSSTNEIRM